MNLKLYSTQLMMKLVNKKQYWNKIINTKHEEMKYRRVKDIGDTVRKSNYSSLKTQKNRK